MNTMIIELWSDSFHEGNWCCENICKQAINHGLEVSVEFLMGFQPVFKISSPTAEIKIEVYGSYNSWEPIPNKVKQLLKWGKPDFIAYDPVLDKILFAVEETAATPTGNQATQRCERQYGSSKFQIPYWYLLSEFGVHRDGGVRRNSIWPTAAALKLTILQKTPCIVLQYSDLNNPEDYDTGNGLELLFSSLYKILINHSNNLPLFHEMENLIKVQYQDMLNFLLSQWSNMIDYLPNEDLLALPSTSTHLTEFALDSPKANLDKLKGFLEWPKISNLPVHIKEKQKARELLKHDDLSYLMQLDIEHGKAYRLSNNSGSGRPPKAVDIQRWISQQMVLFNRSPKLDPEAKFTMKLSDFPDTGSNKGTRHITTAKDIIYLYDSWHDLKSTIVRAYPRLDGKLEDPFGDIPVFLYVSNSLKPGRLFGDPYTGQLSAFSTIFGKFDVAKRMVVVYFPHQSHTQAILNNVASENKGMTLMTELTDYIIFHGGVAVSLNEGRIY